MPVTRTYPGVYIQERSSGVRAIAGVSTSTTALLGRTVRGPVDVAVTVNNFGEFERTFGSLAPFSTVAFAVRDFFVNGGGTAVVVRLYRPPAAGAPRAAVDVPVQTGSLTFEARDEGQWGQNLRLTVDNDLPPGIDAQLGLDLDKLFNLTVVDTNPGGRTELFRAVTIQASPRRVDRMLAGGSKLLRWRGAAPDPATITLGLDARTLAARSADRVTALAALAALAAGATTAQRDTARLALATALNGLRGRRDAVTAAQEVLDELRQLNLAAVALLTDAQAALTAALTTARSTGHDGVTITADELNPVNGRSDKRGLYALEQTDIVNLLCIPPFDPATAVPPAMVALAASYCQERRGFLVVDPPMTWTSVDAAVAGMAASPDQIGTRSDHAALFFPRLLQPNPFNNDVPEAFAPCGAVAGVFARTDADRGVWKAPAGLIDGQLNGVPDLAVPMTDLEQGRLNPAGVNCLRVKPPGVRVVYGARTLQGDDRFASEYKYIPVRRLALYIEESLFRGTQWAVFEPNDEPLWSQIRLNVGAFMQGLFRNGAFAGRTPRDAYFVKCDRETTTPDDVNLGVVNIVVGFAPLKPAEFVVLTLQQIAGVVEG